MQIVEFLIASSLLTLVPGPDILYVTTQSLLRGWRSGVSVALGLCSGLFVHTALATLGISLIISSSSILFNLVKYAGVAYLLYLAVKSLLEARSAKSTATQETPVKRVDDTPAHAPAEIPKTSFGKLYRTGVMMNLLNPKIILFFLAFLPQFVTWESSGHKGEIFALGALFAGQAIVIFTAVSVLAGAAGERISALIRLSPRTTALVNAAVYALIAGALIFTANRA